MDTLDTIDLIFYLQDLGVCGELGLLMPPWKLLATNSPNKDLGLTLSPFWGATGDKLSVLSDLILLIGD